MDIATVARLLSVDVRFVRRLVFERRIPYLKVGRYLRFDVDDVARWIDRQRIQEYENPLSIGREGR